MFGLATIKSMNDEAADRARFGGFEPALFSDADVAQLKGGDILKLSRIPNLGNSLPEGWARVHVQDVDDNSRGVYGGDNLGFGAYFVDSSGFGGANDPAITISAMADRVLPEYGYAIVEAGQFQLKIGMFERL